MLYLDDQIVRHPKFVRAAEEIGGPNAGARALAVYLEGLAYARTQETDGYVPRRVVAASALVGRPLNVATALVRVGLWIRVPSGFRIHDYLDWNKPAKEIRKKRQKWRDKKRSQRHGSNGTFTQQSRAVSQGDRLSPDLSPVDTHRDSRARGTTIHVRTGPRAKDPGTSTACVLTARFARGIHTLPEKRKPTHRILCAMLSAELAADPSIANAIEGVKMRLVRQGFAYPKGDKLDLAVQSVDCVRRRRGAA